VGEAEELGSESVTLEELNWLAEPLTPGDRCELQIRYRARPVAATVTERCNGNLTLRGDVPLRAVTPGQSGVLYSAQGRLLGGGVIS
jgi:tRNA-specific 2-thiouridylase